MAEDKELELLRLRAQARKRAAQAQGDTGKPEGYGETYAGQGLSGINEGLANTLGLPVDLANTAVGLGMRGVNALTGTDLQPSQEPFLGSESIQGMMKGGGAIAPPSEDPGKQFIRRTGESVGATAVPALGLAGKAAKPAKNVIAALTPAATGGAAAATAEQVAPGNATAEIVAELAGSFGPLAGANVARRAAQTKSLRKAIPEVEGLKAQASKLYDDAERLGVRAPQPATKQLADEMKSLAGKEGIISPTGRVSTAYPKIREVIRTFDDYAVGEMTVPQMKAARKTLQAAAKSTDPAERRVATIMLGKFDDFVAPLAPPLKEARSLYHRAMKGDEIEEAMELARVRSGQFSGSGYENALRTDFRSLDRKLAKGQMKGYSDAERKAIERVSRGTTGSNVARNVGKLAPTSAVSFGMGTGVPFMMGNAVGGPGVGAAAGALGAGAGYAGRSVAAGMTRKNAELAALLARQGGPLPKAQNLTEMERRIIAALAAGQGANAGP